VIDGDTVRLQGDQTFRLVGFDKPETSQRAQCAYERDLASRATARLQTLIRTAAVVTGPDGGQADLVAEALSLWFGDKEVLRDISLKIEPGRFVALIGPSG
jgi:endonuclease YncB( thermonuclease family)